MIGEAFADDSNKQNAVMDYMNEEGNITYAELREAIDGIKYSEDTIQEQYTLFGMEEVVVNNFKEKVKLTAKVKSSIGSEKSAFSKLVKPKTAKQVLNVGDNKLDYEANLERSRMLEQVSKIIDFGKNRQGDPINVILNKYATEIKNGMKLSKAVAAAESEIVAVVQDGNYLKLAMQGVEDASNNQMTIGEIENETENTIGIGNEQEINQDSERTEIEGQADFFGGTETTETNTETIQDSDGEIYSNEMSF